MPAGGGQGDQEGVAKCKIKLLCSHSEVNTTCNFNHRGLYIFIFITYIVEAIKLHRNTLNQYL